MYRAIVLYYTILYDTGLHVRARGRRANPAPPIRGAYSHTFLLVLVLLRLFIRSSSSSSRRSRMIITVIIINSSSSSSVCVRCVQV